MIKIDYNFTIADIVGKEGFEYKDFEKLRENVKIVHEKIKNSNIGFFELLNQNINEIKEKLSKLKNNFKNIVVLGIGGSALGSKAIYQACGNYFENYFSNKSNMLFVIDNIDPEYFHTFLKSINIQETLFIIISKSGSTSETISQFLIIKKLLENNKEQLIIITDPQKGNLRKIADKEKILNFDVPPNVGGRYSVLSPVGLVPLYLSGINIDKLIEGAKNIYKYCQSDEIFENPAYLNGILQFLAYKKGKNISVLMPYSSKLEYFTEWYKQLWAESLGKNSEIGPTPLKAIGTTDQHSLLQLFMEGPYDKIITFIKIENLKNIVKIPQINNIDFFDYLMNKNLNDLYNFEMESVKVALAQKGKINYTIMIEKLDEYNIGELIFLYQLSTVFTGFLFNINPFDQPGVEEGKNFTYGLMGRKGYEHKKEQFYNFLKKCSNKNIFSI